MTPTELLRDLIIAKQSLAIGVKEECSVSSILWPLAYRLIFLHFLNVEQREKKHLDGAGGLNMNINKNCSEKLLQKYFTTMFKQARS